MRIERNSQFETAMQLIDEARYIEAITVLDQQLPKAKGIETGIILYWEARCFTSMRRWQEARRCVNQALPFAESDTRLKVSLLVQSAFLLHSEESPMAAVTQLKALGKRFEGELKSPGLLDTYVGFKEALGKCLVLAGQYLEASSELEELLMLQKNARNRYYIRFWLGLAHEHLNALDKAQVNFEAALSELPSDTSTPEEYSTRIRYELALIAYNQHRFADSQRQLRAISSSTTEDADLMNAIRTLRGYLEQSHGHQDRS